MVAQVEDWAGLQAPGAGRTRPLALEHDHVIAVIGRSPELLEAVLFRDTDRGVVSDVDDAGFPECRKLLIGPFERGTDGFRRQAPAMCFG